MVYGLCVLLWKKIILSDLKINWKGPMQLYCDNNLAIGIAHNPVQHDQTKHIEVDCHFIKEKLDRGLACIPYIFLKRQLVGIVTKGLTTQPF